MYYLLFSDGTWNEVNTYEDINRSIKNHWWPWILDREGDSRRWVRIINKTNGKEEFRGSI